jgi:two-component system chemotaxis sensor kinase CheA
VRQEPFDRAELIRYFKEESDELLQQIDADLLRLESLAGSGHTDREAIDGLFRALHTLKGSAGMLELHDTSRLAHSLESVFEILRAGRLQLSPVMIELLFEGRDLLTTFIRAAAEGGSAPPAPTGFMERLETVVRRHEPSAERAPLEHRNAHAPASSKTRPRTIRVDIARLDVVLDLVGELVIAKNRILQIASALTKDDAEATLPKLVGKLNDATARLARTSSDLQEAVMRARMVRIAGVFERFPRMVRDLAKLRGKEVELSIEGADTDIDKTIVDAIGEPLMHLVRNCIDHGIESPQLRHEIGKPERGRIQLRAATEGNSVVITIADDGGGIDLARVQGRAFTLGLIDAELEATEQDLLELLFAPGFSTARTVSEISGRGVGMDVVRRAITRLSGTLEVATRAGKGTTFTIRLPLTLAIVGALLVRIADEIYAVPLDAVTESLRVERSEIVSGPSGEVIRHRGREWRVIRAAEFLELDRSPQTERKVYAVMLNAAGRAVALLVDELLREEEIVVKPLSELVGRLPGIAGGTILGDGQIALILDTLVLVTLAQKAHAASLYSGAGLHE